MDRQIAYSGAIPQDLDILATNRNALVGLGLLALDVLGSSTLVSGLACGSTSPASLGVNVGIGRIYALTSIDLTAYGSIAADTNDLIVKQGIAFATTTLSCPAPVTTGFSVNYLIEAAYQDSDTTSLVLPYYNASNPQSPWSGPSNSGTAQNTRRQGIISLIAKAGSAAATGTQTTPSADTGYVGLYVVTVAYGQTAITSANISTVAGAPFITETLMQKVSVATGNTLWAPLSAPQEDTFTLTAGQTAITLSETPTSIKQIICAIDGSVLIPNVDFTVSGNVLTLTTGATAGQKAAVYYQTTATVFTPQYAATPAEITSLATIVAPQYFEGDWRRYGASLAASDNSAAANMALLVSSNGGAAAYMPPGTWNTTSALNCVQGSSMRGEGESSILQPTGCDGLSFSAQSSYEGTRFFRDFMILGPSTTSSSHNGITINIASGRITGVRFTNLTIQNFAKAVDVEGGNDAWNCAFTDCFLYNNYHGYYFNAGAIYAQIRGGMVQTGAMAGSGNRYGVFCNLTGSSDVQSLHMQGAAIYGYDIQVCMNYGVFMALENCDLSIFSIAGVQITSVSGPVSVRDCWIQAASGSANVIGIDIQDLGTLSNQNILITGNQISGNTSTGTVGVYCGSAQGGVNVSSNIIGTSAAPFVTGVGGLSGLAESPNLVVKNNLIYATTTAVAVGSSATNAEIGPNSILNGAVTLSGPPAGIMYRQPNMSGTATLSGVTISAVTFTTPMPTASYQISLSPSAGSNPWWTSKATTGFTINFGAAYTGSVDWSVTL